MDAKNLKMPLVICLFAAAIVGSFGVGGIREFYRKATPKSPPPSMVSPVVAERWIDALRRNNPKMALLVASQLVPDDRAPAVAAKYGGLAAAENINSRFFNPSFTPLDYVYWLDALRARELVKTIVVERGNVPEQIFNAIKKRITVEKYQQDQPRITFPMEVWEKKKGDAADACLLMAALAIQAGCDAEAVFLFDETQKKSASILCVVVDDTKVCVCDFIGGGFWKAANWWELSNGRSDGGVVPERVVTTLRKGLYAELAQAPDYKPLNQELYKRLKSASGVDLPVFGLDPEERQTRFALRAKLDVDSSRQVLWPLAFEIIKQSPFFYKQWLIAQKK